MLPAPAQGAILVVCRTEDFNILDICSNLNHEETALCTKLERQFLRGLLGGCSTPISAYARVENDVVHFSGNMLSPDGTRKAVIEKKVLRKQSESLGLEAAKEILAGAGKTIIDLIAKSGIT